MRPQRCASTNRILTEVRNGYEEASGAVDKWASKIKKRHAIRVLQAGIKALQDARGALDDIQSARPWIGTDLRKSTPENREGDCRVQGGLDFRRTIPAEGQPNRRAVWRHDAKIHPRPDRRVARYEDAKKQQAEYSAVLRVLRGQANDTDRALLGLSGSHWHDSGAIVFRGSRRTGAVLEGRSGSRCREQPRKAASVSDRPSHSAGRAGRRAAKTKLTEKQKQEIAEAVGRSTMRSTPTTRSRRQRRMKLRSSARPFKIV